MKTPDKIKKGLYQCEYMHGTCGLCPYDRPGTKVECQRELKGDALALIQQLESENARMDQAVENATAFVKEANELIKNRFTEFEADNGRKDDTIRSLTEQLNAAHEETAKAMRERDAAVRDVAEYAQYGSVCKFFYDCPHGNDCPLYPSTCEDYEWRGVCPENTEVQEDE